MCSKALLFWGVFVWRGVRETIGVLGGRGVPMTLLLSKVPPAISQQDNIMLTGFLLNTLPHNVLAYLLHQ